MTYTERYKSMSHQLKARAAAAGKPAFAYLMEMGTGKSKTVIDEMWQLWVEGKIQQVIVFAGKGSYADWYYEHLPLHIPENLPIRSYLWTGAGTKSDQKNQRDYLIAGNGSFRWMIMNIEAAGVSKKAQDFVIDCMKQCKTAVIIDESTSIKNWESKRCQFMSRVVKPMSAYRRGLTGTPVLNSPADLWGLYMFLGPYLLRQNSFYGFRARYCQTVEIDATSRRPDGSTTKRKVIKEVGAKNVQDLAELLKESSFRVRKEDCLDLPPKMYKIQGVEMTDEQYSHYNSLVNSGLAMLPDGGMFNVTNVMTQMLKAHQVLCGYLVDDNKNVFALKNNRNDIIMEQVETLGDREQVVIWFAYRKCLDDVAKMLRDAYGWNSVVEYHGGTSQGERTANLKLFENGKAQFFLSTVHTGCRGIKLITAKHTIYHSNTYNLEHRLQSEDRNHRIGQHWPVTYTDLLCRGTLEEKIVQSLRNKIDIAAAIQSDGPKKWLIPARKKF